MGLRTIIVFNPKPKETCDPNTSFQKATEWHKGICYAE